MLDGLARPFQLRVLRPGQVGLHAGLNLAVEAARAPVCLILDDAVIAAPELVAEHARAHQDHPGILGIGKLTQAAPRFPDWYGLGLARHVDRHYAELAERDPNWGDCRMENLSVPSHTYLEVGGFTLPAVPQDEIELAFRLWRTGCRPQYLPAASGVYDDGRSGHRLLAESYMRGEVYVTLSDRDPRMQPVLLGGFLDTTPREALARRVALALRVSPRWLARLGPLFSAVGHSDEWFEFVSRLAFWGGVRRNVERPRWASLTHGVPVLMYHAFSDSEPGTRYVMPRRKFQWQMRLLRWLGYQVIGFQQLAEALRAGTLPLPRSTVITIDDGYTDNLHVAAPVLQRSGWPATVFLVSDRVGRAAGWTDEPTVAGRPLLSVEQIKEMVGAGLSLGAHTRTHPHLPQVADDEVVRHEIVSCRTELEERLGMPFEVFAYPYGGHDSRAHEAVAMGGYVGAATTDARFVRPNDDPAQIPRLEIRGDDSLLRFLIQLWFGRA